MKKKVPSDQDVSHLTSKSDAELLHSAPPTVADATHALYPCTPFRLLLYYVPFGPSGLLHCLSHVFPKLCIQSLCQQEIKDFHFSSLATPPG